MYTNNYYITVDKIYYYHNNKLLIYNKNESKLEKSININKYNGWGDFIVYKNNIYVKPLLPCMKNNIYKYDLNGNLLLKYEFCNFYEKYNYMAFSINSDKIYIIIANGYLRNYYINIYDILESKLILKNSIKIESVYNSCVGHKEIINSFSIEIVAESIYIFNGMNEYFASQLIKQILKLDIYDTNNKQLRKTFVLKENLFETIYSPKIIIEKKAINIIINKNIFVIC